MPFMKGMVEVVEPTEESVPSQIQIDRQGQQQLAPLLAELEVVKNPGPPRVTQEIGPGGTTIWHVQAGGRGLDRFVELFEFLSKDLTIQEGNTVIWTSPTFHPGREAPEFVLPEFQEAGPPILKINPEVLFQVKPLGEFDGTGYWNSGTIGADAPIGASFAMTFSKAGSFDYICALHVSLGMEGSVTVVERTTSVVAQLNGLAAQFPEGLAIDENGTLFAGMAPTGEIREFAANGSSTTYAQLPAPGVGFLLSMEIDTDGNLFAAMSSFDEATHGIWKVPASGGDGELFAALPVEGFPNALAFDASGDMFVTDTIGGAIWKIDSAGSISTWTSDDLLIGTLPPGPLGFPIGANRIAFDTAHQNVYVANTDNSRIVRIPVNGDGSPGAASVFVEDAVNLGGPDGITFCSDGYLYVALVGSDAVAKVSPSGAITVLAQGGPLQNPSDVSFGVGDDSGTLYAANFAVFRLLGLLPGIPNPAILTIAN